jgi:hypothetical protein
MNTSWKRTVESPAGIHYVVNRGSIISSRTNIKDMIDLVNLTLNKDNKSKGDSTEYEGRGDAMKYWRV